MTHEQKRAPSVAEIQHARIRLAGEVCVSARQDLIYDQNIGSKRSGNSKCQSRAHAAAVGLDGLIDEGTELCEVDYLFREGRDPRRGAALEEQIEANVLKARLFSVPRRCQGE